MIISLVQYFVYLIYSSFHARPMPWVAVSGVQTLDTEGVLSPRLEAHRPDYH